MYYISLFIGKKNDSNQANKKKQKSISIFLHIHWPASAKPFVNPNCGSTIAQNHDEYIMR